MNEVVKTTYSYNNHATAFIEKCCVAPYYSAKRKKCYRVLIFDIDNYLYYVSVFETYVEACNRLDELGFSTSFVDYKKGNKI
jgi:hypothetical protein